MKLDTIFESPMRDLNSEAQQQIANEFQQVSRLAAEAANAILSGKSKEYVGVLEEFDYRMKKLRSQIEQR